MHRLLQVGRRSAWLLLAGGTVVWTGLAVPVAASAADSGRWVAPLSGPLLVDRTADVPADLGERPWQAAHRGVDLLGGVGDPVRAANDGVVVFAGVVAGRSVVSVDHPASRTDDPEAAPIRTTYEPVTPSVSIGDVVATGAIIGAIEPGGTHCWTTCLHWGARRGDTYLDPLALLDSRTTELRPHLADAAALGLADSPSPDPAHEALPAPAQTGTEQREVDVSAAESADEATTSTPTRRSAAIAATSIAAAAVTVGAYRRRSGPLPTQTA